MQAAIYELVLTLLFFCPFLIEPNPTGNNGAGEDFQSNKVLRDEWESEDSAGNSERKLPTVIPLMIFIFTCGESAGLCLIFLLSSSMSLFMKHDFLGKIRER